MNFETWILKMRRANKVPFGTAYELFAREAWTAALAIERETCEALELERDALAAQVAKIRAEAMEEAAALCESKIERPAGFGGRFEGYGKFMDSLSGDECAALIRARIPG